MVLLQCSDMSKAVTRLYNSFQPEHYDLRLEPDATSGIARGSVTIRGKRVGKPSSRMTFHGLGITVLAATITKHDKKLGDVSVEISRINTQETLNEIRLHTETMLYPGDYTISLDFESKVQDSMHGIYKSRYTRDGKDLVLISTQFESHHAREAFPCIDEPEAKATIDLTLVTAADETVISNMPAVSQEVEDDRLVSVFQTTPRMSTYLLAFAIGEMQHKTTKTKDGVSVSVYATLNHRPEALDFALETTRRCIEFFNEYYGVPYPLPKCDMVAIPDFSSAAMENWGLVTYREPFILADPASAGQSTRELIATVICHELSHQWFGNLVTMKWWDDLWLNESFANVMEYVGVDALFPDWHVFNSFTAGEGLSAFRRDSIAGVQSIKTEVKHPDEISTLFDPSIVYAKGGRLINMLRTYIGDDDFRKGLKAYFDKHAYGNTTGDDLWAALSQASGKDVGAFMDPWLKQSGFPLLRVDQNDGSVTVEQRHLLLDNSKADADRIWPVPLFATDAGAPEVLDTASTSFKAQNEDYIRVNQGAVGHYVVEYAQAAHRNWLAGLVDTKTLNESERLMLLSDSTMLARSGSTSIADSLELLEHYGQEDAEPVWDIMSLVLADVRRFIDAEPQLEDHIKSQIRSLITTQYERLGWDEREGESAQDTKLRGTILGLGAYAEHPEIKQQALDLFAAYRKDSSVVSSELRGIIFTCAVRYGEEADFDYLLKLESETSDPTIKQELLAALSSTRDTLKGALLLARLKDPKAVRPHDVDHWLVYLMRSRYNQEQSWQWLRDEWPWIEKQFGGDKSYDSFPRYAASAFNTRQRLDEYRAFFSPMVDQPLLTRNITMGIEELENRIDWIERDLTKVNDFYGLS